MWAEILVEAATLWEPLMQECLLLDEHDCLAFPRDFSAGIEATAILQVGSHGVSFNQSNPFC